MAKFKAPFFAVPPREIYPRWYEAGEDCPADYEDAARMLGVLEDEQQNHAVESRKVIKRVSRKG